MKRIFTFEEARSLVPIVRERTREALEQLELHGLSENGTEDASRIVDAWAHDVEALGLEVKGPWLVDFDSGAGYFCWRWPEEALDFYHGYAEGFSGRVRIQ